MNIATLNPYQAEQLREWVAKLEEDRENGYIEPDPEGKRSPFRLEWWPCAVPGIVAVMDAEGNTMKLLYPVPRPVPKDPLFQHARGVERWHYVMGVQFSHGRRDYWMQNEFDHGVYMDAPFEMPAGSTSYFDAGDDNDEAYGAVSESFFREE